jgi:hypothetical protein
MKLKKLAPNAQDFTGLSVVDAANKARELGLRSRMTSIDGQPCIIHADFDPLRLNFAVQDGLVMEASFG